jgi:hypothetical protein
LIAVFLDHIISCMTCHCSWSEDTKVSFRKENLSII